MTHLDLLELTAGGPVLLYDGECGVCNRTVGWFLAHESSESQVRFAALESELGRALRAEAKVPAHIESVLWIEQRGTRVVALDRSSAILRLAQETASPWKHLAWLRLIPSALRDFCYERFAAIRHRVVAPACFVPAPTQRVRFLSE